MIIDPRYVYILTRNEDKGFGLIISSEIMIKSQIIRITLCVFGNQGCKSIIHRGLGFEIRAIIDTFNVIFEITND